MTRPPVQDRAPVFLERRGYRARRMMDAVRLLPFLGLGLCMVPLLWPVAEPTEPVGGTQMSAALRYVFGIWAAMVLASAALWMRTRKDQPAGTTPPDAPG